MRKAGIVRHDWYVDGNSVVCEKIEDNLKSWERNPPPGCAGCLAKMSDPRIDELRIASEDSQDFLDRLWYKEFRPMAALCGLVEEATDTIDNQ